jgi:hypothetical protein
VNQPMSFPYLEKRDYWALTVEEQRALNLHNFWDTGLSPDQVYNGAY